MYVKLSYEKKLREMYENNMRSSLSVTLISAHYTKIMSKSGLKWGVVVSYGGFCYLLYVKFNALIFLSSTTNR